MRLGAILWLGIQTLVISSGAVTGADLLADPESVQSRRILRVSLYPFIPDAKSAAWIIEEAFERRYPTIDLRISFAPRYYDHRPGKGGVIDEVADVYELDSIFLADFVEANRLQPVKAAAAAMIPFAERAASHKGVTYGTPHWVCGNFLIYRSPDTALREVRTLHDLENAFSQPLRERGGLLIDLKGSSTLGEMYLDGLMDLYQSTALALQRLDAQNPDRSVLNAMERVIKLSQSRFGRDEDYHQRSGFYGRQFARGNGRALVGYSELLHYVLTEASQSCLHDEKCVDPARGKHASQIAVTEWPLADEGSQPIGWVDLFVVDVAVKGQRLRDARAFISFMIENETYRMLLIPDLNIREAPRYLLPAREDVYSDSDVLAAAPLYTSFRKAINNAISVSAPKLNERLRAMGAALDGALPGN
ncbi:hypothetical protein [Bradyrhizobium sp. URHD0069]|uniref:hypothetical protein n=1 Tax=Bradyrhizobium sp. URHD0069 TaxID=1380355 RepID=UPI000495A94E|nr:hypothetical protein [Bradyrhizobium sp. URHD0069]